MTAKTTNKRNDFDFTEAVDLVDQETVEVGGASYPPIQWVNGKPSNKKAGDISYTGGWFIASENAPGAMPDGWEPCELVHDMGDTTEGFAIRDITVALVRTRARWFYTGSDGSRAYVPWDQFERGMGMRGHRQVLVCVKGLEDTPMMLTMKGMASATFDEAVRLFVRNVISPANALVRPKRWPHRAFWITLGPQRDGQGNPVFTVVGRGEQTQKITLMTSDAPPKPLDKQGLQQRFVGRDLLARLQEWWEEADEWVHAWDQAGKEGEEEEHDTAAENGHSDENLPDPEPMNF